MSAEKPRIHSDHSHKITKTESHAIASDTRSGGLFSDAQSRPPGTDSRRGIGRRVFKGYTLQHALRNASTAFGVPIQEVEYRIIKKRSRLGVLIPTYIIEATPRVSTMPEDRSSRPSAQPGLVGIEDGRIVYVAPKNHGKYPTISAGEGVSLNISGKSIRGPIVLFPDVQVEVITEQQDPALEVSISVSDDGMLAEAIIHRRPGYRYLVKDSPPVTDLVVEAERKCLPPPALSEDALRQALQDAGVIYGIDEDAIQRALSAPTPDPIVIARGTPAVTPLDDAVEWLIPVTATDWTSTSDPYLDSLTIAKAGEVIAVYHPGRVGQPGRDVRGNEIVTGEPHRCTLQVGKGAILRTKGRAHEAVYLKTGRPTVIDGHLCVLPMRLIEGDLTNEHGCVTFDGDVVVTGNVLDNARVRATGSILVKGMASGAHLVAGGNVIIHRGVTRSEVYAGGEGAAFARVHTAIDQLLRSLSQVVRRALKDRRAARPHPSYDPMRDPLFRRIHATLAGLMDIAETAWEQEVLGELQKLLRRLRWSLTPAKVSHGVELDTLVDLYRHLLTWRERAQSALRQKGFIRAPYAQNSRLSACGDIVLTNAGCYYTRLIATGDILLKGSRGFLRGSEVTAGGRVEAEEIGTYSNSETRIEVSRQSEVRARLVHPGTVLKIDDQTFHFAEARQMVEARLSPSGSFDISYVDDTLPRVG